MVWTMWQGWHDENQKNVRLERELKHLTTLLRRVADERDKLKEERDRLEEERDKLEEERDKLEEENTKLRNS